MFKLTQRLSPNMQNSIEKSRVKINEHLFWFTILGLNSADIYQLRTGTDMGTPYTHDVVSKSIRRRMSTGKSCLTKLIKSILTS